jgi:hypothetical protein
MPQFPSITNTSCSTSLNREVFLYPFFLKAPPIMAIKTSFIPTKSTCCALARMTKLFFRQIERNYYAQLNTVVRRKGAKL